MKKASKSEIADELRAEYYLKELLKGGERESTSVLPRGHQSRPARAGCGEGVSDE